MAILKVEPLTTARALRGPFDYRRPSDMEELGIGSLVRVPFGPRRLLGVVVELAETSDLAPERLAEPIEALEAGASPELVELGLWVAREYCSTPSRGLSLVLPPGTGTGRAARTVRAKTELRAEITPAGEAALEGGGAPGVKGRVVAAIGGEKGAMEEGETRTGVDGGTSGMGDGETGATGRGEAATNSGETDAKGGGERGEAGAESDGETGAEGGDQVGVKDGRAVIGGGRLGVRQRAVLEALAGGGETSAPQLRATVGADRATLRRLADRGLIALRDSSVRRAPVASGLRAAAEPPRLLPEQQNAVDALVAALDGEAGAPREQLLHGVTGSGKTEVYLAAVEAALARGRGAIVLVPEIGLAPQAVARFRARLGDRFAVLHSALSDGERFDEWQRLRSGEAQVCVGPRSAVFAPVRDLGLVVIDEEHDPSYKQEGDPSYDARAVARHRARERGAVLVAGTATPRPETWLELPRLELPRRVDGLRMPPVNVVDMREVDPRSGPLHADTWTALEEVRAAGRKAIVMINRRGFAPWLTCRSCGHHWGCPNCDVSLIVHRESGRLVCHHCAHTERAPHACPKCSSTTLARAGAGTERIEELLRERLAPMPIFRLDSDTTAPRGAHARILAEFGEATSAVLVGTQMVAKGHDFPEVTLSAILDADATLRFPDFRAEERTFAMVAQLAGRSGRGAAGGEVMVQTLAPGAASIERAAAHDSAGFLAGELERRRILLYPPYSHLLRVNLSSESEDRVDEAARGVAGDLRSRLPADSDLLGPAPMFRMRGRHRRRILVKAQDRAGTVAAARAAVERRAADRGLKDVAIGVDVDPQ